MQGLEPVSRLPHRLASMHGIYFTRLLTLLTLSLLTVAALFGCAPGGPRGPVIFAASSLQKPLESFAEEWVASGNDAPVFSFASSAALARQIENGSPADIFISADSQWTDYITAAGELPTDASKPIAGNRLVLARSTRQAPLDYTGLDAAIEALAAARTVATGDPETVPLGRFAREALEKAGLWNGVSPRLVRTPSSSAALKLTLLGEADVGILYASDAQSRDDLGIIYTFPAEDHSPIVYRAILLPSSAHPDATAFLDALTNAEARAMFDDAGFSRP